MEDFTAIPNDILDALCQTRIAGQARQVFDTILRKTNGFQKKEDWISLSQISAITRLKHPTICKCINYLLLCKFITKNGNGVVPKYSINSKIAQWKPLPKKVTITKKGNKDYPKRKSSLPKMVDTKETITKETITKETPSSGKPPSDVHILFDKYCSHYEQKLKTKYVPPAADRGKIFRQIKLRLKETPLEQWLDYIPKFFDNIKNRDNGYNIMYLLACEHSARIVKPPKETGGGWL